MDETLLLKAENGLAKEKRCLEITTTLFEMKDQAILPIFVMNKLVRFVVFIILILIKITTLIRRSN
jgi:hypothetical protein